MRRLDGLDWSDETDQMMRSGSGSIFRSRKNRRCPEGYTRHSPDFDWNDDGH